MRTERQRSRSVLDFGISDALNAALCLECIKLHRHSPPAPSDGIKALVCGFPERVRGNRCLVVLQGFVDDSRTSDGAGHANAFVLGGFLAVADDWTGFSDDFESTCDRYPKTPDWHMCEAFRLKGRYKWRDETERDARIRELVAVILKWARYRLDTVVSGGNYDMIVRGKLPKEIDDPYFLCFYSLILSAAEFMNKANLEGTVDFVFDEQGKLGAECVRWYYWVKQNSSPDVQKRLGSTPIFRHDRDVLPLKAADIYAWQIRRHLSQEQPTGIPHNDNTEALLDIPGVSCYFTPEDLESLVSESGLRLRRHCLFKMR